MYPQVHPYRHEPNEFIRIPGVTVNIEYLAISYPNADNTIVETHRAGRTAVIIEGEDAEVANYLEAIQKVMAGEGVTK